MPPQQLKRISIDAGSAEPDGTHSQGDIGVEVASGKASVSVPFGATDQIYLQHAAAGTRLFGDLRTGAGSELDERGLYALLAFGGCVPPFTPFTGVERLMPGCVTSVDLGSGATSRTLHTASWPEPATAPADEDARVRRVTDALDDALRQVCPDERPVILFSGGVDSGLLAARASSLGWKETVLVHFSIGEDDAETLVAREMADHLGLRIDVVADTIEDTFEPLERAGELYPQPFGDHSTMPTYRLARQTIERTEGTRTVLDGTGADGAFGLFSKAAAWNKVRRVPRPLAAMSSAIYGPLSLQLKTSRLEFASRLFRRATRMPLLSASIAQNPLEGVCYRFDRSTRDDVHGAVQQWLDDAAPELCPEAQIGAVDIALICANIFAQKARSVYDGAGRRVVYPFLDGRVISLGLREAVHWPDASEAKQVLKAALKRSVPDRLVDRPKSGFSIDTRPRFAQPEFLDILRRSVEQGSPLAPHLDRRRMLRLVDHLAAQRRAPAQTSSFAWLVAFTARWLEQTMPS